MKNATPIFAMLISFVAVLWTPQSIGAEIQEERKTQMSQAVLANRVRQYEPWAGPAPAEPMPSGQYFQIKRSAGYELTANQDCWSLWDLINGEAQGFSAVPPSMSPVPTRDVVEKAINAINRIFAGVSSRTVSRANQLFSTTFGGPNGFRFEPYPIRWTGESRFALMTLLDIISCAYQLEHVRSNCVDNGILEEHAITVLHPIFMAKGRIMRDMFGMETKGSISPNELQAIFRNSNIAPPLTSSFDDLRDLQEDRESEDAVALTDESAPKPDEGTMRQITSGVEIWQFTPDMANWTTFAEIQRRMEESSPTQRPAEPFPFTVDVISGSGESDAGDRTFEPVTGGGQSGLVNP